MEKYPDGKLNEDDEGTLTIAMFISEGRAIVEFGNSTKWIGFDKESLKKFINGLEEKYQEL